MFLGRLVRRQKMNGRRVAAHAHQASFVQRDLFLLHLAQAANIVPMRRQVLLRATVLRDTFVLMGQQTGSPVQCLTLSSVRRTSSKESARLARYALKDQRSRITAQRVSSVTRLHYEQRLHSREAHLV